jgi:hypothetical protein
VLRDLFKRGKYPDVILPMRVLRRMDAVLEPTKAAVLETRRMLDAAGITEQRAALANAAGQAFYNTSRFTLRDLRSRGSRQQLLADFEDYLNDFSPNVQDVLENFKFRNQLPTLSKNDAIGTLIDKFLDPEIDLSPTGIDNHAMGTIFEELVRRFNEENNEEAGEHWTPRDAVRLMANLVFLPIEDQLKSGTYLLYDCACGTGGMLTVAEETLGAIASKRGLQIDCHLYGQEINPETYAVCKADMLLKGEGANADQIVGGAEWSTLSHDAYPGQPRLLPERPTDWSSDEDEGNDEEEDGGTRKGLPERAKKKLLDPKTWERDGRLAAATETLRAALVDTLFEDHNLFRRRVVEAVRKAGLKLAAADLKQLFKAVSWRDETAPPVIARAHRLGRAQADPLRGLFEATIDGRPAIVEYEPDSDRRDTEQMPLLEEGGIEAFIRREVLPYTPDAWIKEDVTKIGYEISFTRHFYKPQPLRTLEEIRADILAIEKEAEGLLDGLLKGGSR